MEYRHRAFWPPDMPRSLAPARTTLHDMLESAAQRFPGNPATIFQDETLTWAEVRRRVDALAGHLRHECGVRRSRQSGHAGRPDYVRAGWSPKMVQQWFGQSESQMNRLTTPSPYGSRAE